jgi:putative dimethyl sulfoxide reductase chaperone
MQAALADEEVLEALPVDYTRLFIGPFSPLAPPYESVYRGGEVMGASTAAVMGLYRMAGFDLSGDFHEAPDHIAAELEFVYVLQAGQSQCKMAGETAKLTDRVVEQAALSCINGGNG